MQRRTYKHSPRNVFCVPLFCDLSTRCSSQFFHITLLLLITLTSSSLNYFILFLLETVEPSIYLKFVSVNGLIFLHYRGFARPYEFILLPFFRREARYLEITRCLYDALDEISLARLFIRTWDISFKEMG